MVCVCVSLDMMLPVVPLNDGGAVNKLIVLGEIGEVFNDSW